MTLSLTDVAQKVQLVNEPEAERFVRSMVSFSPQNKSVKKIEKVSVI